MVFNTEQDIFEAIKKVQQVPKWILKARDYHKDMKALLFGDEFKDLLLQIQHIESDNKALARKKYARSIKDINAKILEPVNNVYSATGGGKQYNVSDTQRADLIRKISNVRGGLSLEQWLQTYWAKDLYNADPSGLIMLEWLDDNVYPTYKSVCSIRDYAANGMNVEYVIFEPKTKVGTAEKHWRVVDDEKDYTVIQVGDSFSLDIENTNVNPFGAVPARICSDKIKIGEEYRLAPIDNIIESEKEFLSDRSILTIFKFLNGFSTPYRPKILCPSCRGTKKIGVADCPDCGGRGTILDKDVTDEIIIPIDLNSENPVTLPANFAGFISPDLEIWDQYMKGAKTDFDDMFEVMWGTRESEAKDQTAMSVILNTQPMITRLNAWSNVGESHEKAFTEWIANFLFPTKSKADKIAVISYGRNYIIQPPEYLLSEYQTSNEKKDPITIRDRKLTEYLTSKYKSDPQTLRTELMKKDLEPYVHYDIELVSRVYGVLEAQKKGMFTDWWETLTQADLIKDRSKLEIMRDAWFNSKISAILQNTDKN